MGDSNGLRQELAALIRDNEDEISKRLERRYVEEYPHSRANLMDAREIHRWTLSEIESIARLMETGDLSLRTYRGYYGDPVEDPYNPELTAFASFVSANLFEARHIAPIFFRMREKDATRMSAITDIFEQTMQDVIAYNCEIYAASIKLPGSLFRTWDMLSGMVPQGDPVDTPAKRYLESSAAEELSHRVEHGSGGGVAVEAHAYPGKERLSDRERDVLQFLIEGKTNGEIAGALGLRQNTVKNHVAHIFDKCNVNTRAELVALVLGGDGRGV